MATDPALSDELVNALGANGDSPESPQQNGTKRKNDDSGAPSQPAQRSKRNRYIAIACNECKRRKIKCNGQTPCQRCGNLNLECVYAPNCCTNNFKDSQEFKAMSAHIQSLQDQVNSLSESLNQLRSTLGYDVPNLDPNLYSHTQGRNAAGSQSSTMGSPLQTRERDVGRNSFQGPTSSAYNLGIAKSGLRHMGISVPEDIQNEASGVDGNGNVSVVARPKPAVINPDKDPIWSINKEEALRLCNVYEDEIGMMYPFLDMQRMSGTASQLFSFVDAANRSGLMRGGFMGEDAMYGEDVDTLKLILADAMACESGGETEMSKRLFESVCTSPETRLMKEVDLQSIKILTLTAIYHFQIDDEALSWRVVGITARLCMELGLHRAETYEKLFSDQEDRNQALKLFWSIYVLDRRWSFGTGMSFALQDSDIDSALPKPNISSPYLTQMIEYSHLGSSAWKALASASRDSPIRKEELEYLEYQIKRWKDNTPNTLRFIHPSSEEYSRNPSANEEGGRGIYRLRVILYLRGNQLRIIINRPVLHSTASISSNPGQAQEVVSLAKDNIRILTHINQTSDIYRTQQMCFNYFLLSALGAIFLAISFAPNQFCDSSREEWDMALDLVRGLSAHSYVSKRLWNTIRKLKEVGPKLGLPERNDDSTTPTVPEPVRQTLNAQSSPSTRRGDATKSAQRPQSSHPDAHSYAAMAMAGLAGHPVDESMFYSTTGPQRAGQTFYGQAASPNGIANDLTTLYEAAQGYSQNGSVIPAASPSQQSFAENGALAYGNEDEFNRIMSEMF